MRDYGKVSAHTWIDYKGRVWPVITHTNRLKFKYPAHAALRDHVFNRDGFKCQRCSARAITVPDGWAGECALMTDTRVSSGYPDILILDHMLTLRAGGLSVIANLQTLCETCNKKKTKEDVAAAIAYRECV